nr:MAG TPA: hypothetical protein [Caudoviricetes sp.]
MLCRPLAFSVALAMIVTFSLPHFLHFIVGSFLLVGGLCGCRRPVVSQSARREDCICPSSDVLRHCRNMLSLECFTNHVIWNFIEIVDAIFNGVVDDISGDPVAVKTVKCDPHVDGACADENIWVAVVLVDYVKADAACPVLRELDGLGFVVHCGFLSLLVLITIHLSENDTPISVQHAKNYPLEK